MSVSGRGKMSMEGVYDADDEVEVRVEVDVSRALRRVQIIIRAEELARELAGEPWTRSEQFTIVAHAAALCAGHRRLHMSVDVMERCAEGLRAMFVAAWHYHMIVGRG